MALLTSLFAAAGAMLAAVPALAAEEGIEMQALLKDDGSGFLFVNTPQEPMTWEACSSTLTNCTPFGSGGELATAGASPVRIFRVTGGAGSIGLSPVWHGNVSSTSPPSVRGSVRANELVTPVPGGWGGGWGGDEPDFMQLSACPTPTGENCVTLTHSHYAASCANEAAVLDPAFVGDYLRVADRRNGAGPHIVPLYGVGSPYGLDIWTAGPRTSAAIVGRIAPAQHRRTARCGPPPLNAAAISKRGVAIVECRLGCRTVLIAKHKRRRARVVRRLPRKRALPRRLGERPIPLRGPAALRPPRRFSAPLGHRRVRVIVKIDGRQAARRTVRLPAQ